MTDIHEDVTEEDLSEEFEDDCVRAKGVMDDATTPASSTRRISGRGTRRFRTVPAGLHSLPAGTVAEFWYQE